MSQTRTLYYSLIKPLISVGAFLFFRRFTSFGKKNLPVNRPVVLVANHQNAMLDPVMAGIFSHSQLHWLTRADLFKKPEMNKLLRKLNMLPVFRERDRVVNLFEKNQETFEECYARLKQNAVISIFPEGSHRGKKQLMPLKKGTARMIFGAIDSGVENLCVVPVGLDYENYYTYRKELLVIYGEPIEISFGANLTTFEKAKAQTIVTEKIREGLSQVMIDIKNDDVYHEILLLKPISDKLCKSRSQAEQFAAFKKLTVELDQNSEHHHRLNREVNEYKSLMHQLRIREVMYAKYFPFWKILFVALFMIPSIISAIFFYPIYAITENFVRKVIKDLLFKNSIRLCFWTFITPVWLLIFFLVLKFFSKQTMIAFYATNALFAGGIIALYWWEMLKHLRQHVRCMKFRNSDSELYASWKEKRTLLIEWVKELNQTLQRNV